MIRQISFLFVLLLTFSITSALCGDGQIDINIASATELDSLYGIGPVKANAIIDARPFNSVDNLIDVYGIGDATLTKIKDQGLACVESEEDITEEEPEEDKSKNNQDERIINDKSEINETFLGNLGESSVQESGDSNSPINFETIELNPKHIKTEENIENLDKNNLGVYGFVIFCILLAILFILNKKPDKTEFD